MVSHDQKRRDADRKSYVLTFPADLDHEQVVAWFRTLSGTLGHRPWPAVRPTVVLELWVTSKGIQHRLKVPWQNADYVLSQLRSLVPGIRAEPDEEHPRRLWKYAVEVGLTRSNRPLRIYNAEQMAVSLMGAANAVEGTETVLMQWVVSPMKPVRKPQLRISRTDRITLRSLAGDIEASRDEIHERRAKLEEPNLVAVLRVAAAAETKNRAKHLVRRVRDALSATRSPDTRFIKRLLTADELQRRIDRATTPTRFPMQLNAAELGALVAWPIGSPLIAGLPPRLGKQFPPSEHIPRDGIVVGNSTFPGGERPVAIGYEQALMHTWVGGSTGVGKSVLLANMAKQVMQQGHGLILIETEGNLYESTLNYVPKERVNDVALLDVTDTEMPVGFNVLDQTSHLAAIDQLINLFNHKYNTSLWAEEHLWFGLRTIAATPGLAFTDLAPLLVPRADEVAWVDHITRRLTDPELLRWWQRQDNRDRKSVQQRTDPLLSRIWQLTSRPELRNIFGQAKSTIRIEDVLRDNGILLVNLKGVSKEAAGLIGTLIMNTIWHATKSVRKQRPTYIVLDEFADFMDLPIDTESMLAQARKHKVGLILANQHLSQLKREVQDGIITNARNKIVLTTNAADAQVLSRGMDDKLDPIDFTTLQAYEAIAQIMTPNGVSPPASIRTLPPAAGTGQGRKARHLSRYKYGRPREDVMREIERRREAPGTDPSRRPIIGRLDPEDFGRN